MYWPYLRNRTNELFAIKEISPTISATRLVVPILNIVNMDGVFSNRIASIAKGGQRISMLTNAGPIAQRAAVEAELKTLLANFPGVVLPGLEISSSTTALDVSNFVAAYKATQCVFVHRTGWANTNLQALLAGLKLPPAHVYLTSAFNQGKFGPVTSVGNVILSDGFQRQNTNGAYPSVSPFQNFATSYLQSGYQGFGDFAAIGDHYKTGGGQASHVALHVTELQGSGVICNHFVSSSIPVSSQIHFKYDDCLSQLRSHVGVPPTPPMATVGMNDYIAPHSFPGLGMPKRWSLKHHIELMARVLTNAGAQPFI